MESLCRPEALPNPRRRRINGSRPGRRASLEINISSGFPRNKTTGPPATATDQMRGRRLLEDIGVYRVRFLQAGVFQLGVAQHIFLLKLRRCSSTFLFTRLPFWTPIFEPQKIIPRGVSVFLQDAAPQSGRVLSVSFRLPLKTSLKGVCVSPSLVGNQASAGAHTHSLSKHQVRERVFLPQVYCHWAGIQSELGVFFEGTIICGSVLRGNQVDAPILGLPPF